jgi:hypothetical protein
MSPLAMNRLLKLSRTEMQIAELKRVSRFLFVEFGDSLFDRIGSLPAVWDEPEAFRNL